MTNPPDHPLPVHPIRSALEPVGGDKAPFIYFDRAFACGIVQGAVQVELGAHTIVPASGATATRDEFIVAAHLRCTPSAAQDLMRALERALNMLKRPEGVATKSRRVSRDDSAGRRERGTATARKNARCISSYAQIDFDPQTISTFVIH